MSGFVLYKEERAVFQRERLIIPRLGGEITEKEKEKKWTLWFLSFLFFAFTLFFYFFSSFNFLVLFKSKEFQWAFFYQ